MQNLVHASPLLVGAELLIGLIVLRVVYGVVYNLYFHPLRKFPGPKLAAASQIYPLWVLACGQRHTVVQKWHQQYGEVVRVKPNELSFIGETGWRDIYAHKQGRGQMQKWANENPGQKAYHIQNAPDDIHARQRKMLSHAFSDRALREQEPILKTYIDMFIAILRDTAKQNIPIDIVGALNWVTFDIIGDLSFAESFHNLEQRRLHPFLTDVFNSIRLMAVVAELYTVSLFRLIIDSLLKQLSLEDGFPFIAYSRQLVGKRIEQGLTRPDFMSRILEHNRDDGTGITRDEMDAIMAVVVVAGAETTATLLAGCLYLLSRNKDKLERLKKEVLAEFSNADEITMTTVGRLPYLWAILEESLRVYPPVAATFPRIVPAEGASICGYWVPGGAVVGVPQYVTYHSACNFIEPEAFLPERWLPQKEEKFNKDRTAVLQPFSTGPRNCLGKNLAYAEMKLILARIVFEFDFELEDEKLNWAKQRMFLLWEKRPLMVRLKQREKRAHPVGES